MFYIYLITPWSTYMAQSPKGRLIQGLYKSIHGSCAIYFYPGEVNCVSLFLFCIFPETMFNVNMLSHFCTSSTINHMNPCGTITLCCLDIHACAATFHRPPPHIARGRFGFYLRVSPCYNNLLNHCNSVGKPLGFADVSGKTTLLFLLQFAKTPFSLQPIVMDISKGETIKHH